jgi:HEPN domain-containing protein
MNRADLQRVTRLRVQEAHTLLMDGRFPGAYYLMGYAVECALKACVAKQTRRYDFPDKKLANDVYTHDLEKLLQVAELTRVFEADRRASLELELSWAIVKDWSEGARYETGITGSQARDLYSACTGRNGVLPWVRKRW